MPDPEGEMRRFAESLREAFRRLRSASASDEEKARLTRRLLAVTRAARRDIGSAARKLELVVAQLPRVADPRRHGREGGN